MKKISKIVAIALLTTAFSTANTNSSYIGYQGVAFDGTTAIASTNVTLRFTILDNTNATIYQETQASVATTDKGFFSHQIGSGIRTAGEANYADITWADDYKLQVEIDKDNGTTYTNLGVQDFTSSVYSHRAKSAVTATQLKTPRTINGVSFDGSSNITVFDATKLPTSGGTITGGLVIEGGNTYTLAEYNWFSLTAGEIGHSTNQTADYSVYTTGRVAAAEFNAFSDKRVKTDIKPITHSLETIKHLKPSSYTKIDKVQNGYRKKYGFIAQELEQIIPEAVTKGKGEIPILKRFDDAALEDGVTYVLEVSKDGYATRQEYNTKQPKPEGELFVISKKVDDFRTVDYNMVFTIAVEAIKEQQSEIESLKDQLTQIKNALKESGIKIK